MWRKTLNVDKDPDSIQDCKTCHGWGKVNISSICTCLKCGRLRE